MRALLVYAKSNLIKKKASCILVSIIILLSALILSTAAGMMQMMNKPFQIMFERQNASHVIMYYDKNLNKGKDIIGFWRKQNYIESVNILNAYFMPGYPYFKDQKLNNQFIITEFPANGLSQDEVVNVEGQKAKTPAENEIWIPTAFAYSNNIKIGDRIELPTLSGAKDFTVSSIVVDPHYSNTMLNPIRVWVKNGTLEKSFIKNNPEKYIGLRYKNYSAKVEANAWKEFEKAIGGKFVGLKISYETFVYAYTFLYNILSIILLVFSIIIIIIGFVIIFYTLSSSILADYSTIGVMKAQGFTSRNLTGVYVLQFFLLSIVAAPLGILLSIPVQQVFMNGLTKALGIGQVLQINVSTGIISFLTIIAIVLLSASVSSLKAAGIKPSQAIRYGAPERKYTKPPISLSNLRKLPVCLILGFRDIFTEKKQTAFIVIASLFAGLIFAFSISSAASMNRAFSNTGLFGLDNSEFSVVNSYRVSGIKNEDILRILKSQKEIKSVTPTVFLINSSFYIKDLNTTKDVVGNAFDADMDSIGLTVMEGRNPVNDKEIAISYGLAKKLHIKPGDTVQVNLEGTDKAMFVTGTFQNMNNGGDGFRVQMKGINKSSIQSSVSYQVKLKDPAITNAYEKVLNKKLGKMAEINNNSSMIKKTAAPILSSMMSTTTLLLVVVILVCFVTIFNAIAINILQMKKKYGIYKAFGMTSLEIRNTIVFKVLIASTVGTLAGIIGGILATSFMMSTIFGLIGIAKMETVIEPAKLILVIPACLFITALSAWLPSGRILKINPRDLIIE